MMKAKRAQNCAVCGYRMEAGTNIGWANGAPYHLKPSMMTLEEAAAHVGIGKNSRYKAAKAGELCPGVPIVKVGGVYRVPIAALEAVLGIQLGVKCTPANVGAHAVKRINDDRRDVTVQGNLYGPKTGPTI